MVAATIRHRAEGPVPFDPFRHLGPVTDLIAQVFAPELGPEARHVLRRMQRMARWGGLGLLLWGAEAGGLGAPGFVWLEGGQVVGNVSLRRAASPGGWMIGNVVVRPDRQRRGIGRALMEAALGEIEKGGGAWAGLEVREDNAAALRLYEGMGFEPIGASLELLRPAGRPWPAQPSLPFPLRRGRATDGGMLYRLAQEGLSRPQQEVLEVRPSAYRAGWEARLDAWLEGCCEGWWLAEEGGRPAGAVRLSSRWPARWHQIEILVRRERLSDLGPGLVAAGISLLSRRRPWEVTTTLAGAREALEPAFNAAGFRRLRRLVQMRRVMGQRIGAGQ